MAPRPQRKASNRGADSRWVAAKGPPALPPAPLPSYPRRGGLGCAGLASG